MCWNEDCPLHWGLYANSLFRLTIKKAQKVLITGPLWNMFGKYWCYHREHYGRNSLFIKRTIQWRHNDHDGVSNHQPHGCLLNRLFRRRSKGTSKLRVTGPCVGNSPGPVNSPHKEPVTRKMFLFDDVIMKAWGYMCTSDMCNGRVLVLYCFSRYTSFVEKTYAGKVNTYYVFIMCIIFYIQIWFCSSLSYDITSVFSFCNRNTIQNLKMET